MNDIFLISEDRIKTITNINDNVYDEYLAPAIANAQAISLQSILGSCLYEHILSLVSDGSITAETNTAYKYLLDNQIRYYLAWKVVADIIPVVTVKIDNAGAVRNTDEHREHLTTSQLDLLVSHYQDIADSYQRMLQDYLKVNKDLYPELGQCGCSGIKPNLQSSNSSQIWLGGVRSRIYKDGCNC